VYVLNFRDIISCNENTVITVR